MEKITITTTRKNIDKNGGKIYYIKRLLENELENYKLISTNERNVFKSKIILEIK